MFTLNQRLGNVLPLPFDWLARVESAIARFWSRSRRERHVWLVSAGLHGLDDRMLKDIGLQRHQTESAVLHGQRTDWYAPLAGMNHTERHNNNDF